MGSAPADWRKAVGAEAAARIEVMASSLADQFGFAQHALALVSLLVPAANGWRNGSADVPGDDHRSVDPAKDPAHAGGTALDVLRSIGEQPRGRIATAEADHEDAPSGYRVYTRQFDAVWEVTVQHGGRTRRRLETEALRRFAGAQRDFSKMGSAPVPPSDGEPDPRMAVRSGRGHPRLRASEPRDCRSAATARVQARGCLGIRRVPRSRC